MWKKINLDKDIKILLSIVIVIFFIGILFSIASFYVTYKTESLGEKVFCISSACLADFFKTTDGIVKVFQATGWLLTIVATMGGIIIALLTYKSGIKNSKLSNHISHLNMFRDFINAEILKRKYITSDKVNIFKWYTKIFPNSKVGDVFVSDEYKELIDNLESIVNEANEAISSPDGKYEYRKHQLKIISGVELIGIKVSTGTKNDFIIIETQLFDLIDCVNMTFTSINKELSNLDRKYI
jgi:hypothetical protein